MIGFDWFSRPEVKNVLSMVYTIIDVIRIIVPIVLIVMTTIDITKKIIDPNEKEGQKKIMYRAIAAVIVFLIPLFINIVFKIMDIDINNLSNGSGGTSTPKPTIKPTITPKPTLSSLSITNCPRNSIKYHVGDTVKLDSSIPNSFNGEIKWEVLDKSVSRIIGFDNGKDVTIKLLSEPKVGAAYITLTAGGKVDTCYVDVISFDDLLITNCPDNSNVYHVGDRIKLETNIPSTYYGTISWSTSDNYIKVTPSSDGKEAEIEILSIPNTDYVSVAISARSGQTVTSCSINVK